MRGSGKVQGKRSGGLFYVLTSRNYVLDVNDLWNQSESFLSLSHCICKESFLKRFYVEEAVLLQCDATDIQKTQRKKSNSQPAVDEKQQQYRFLCEIRTMKDN